MGRQKEIKKFYEFCVADYDKHMVKTGHYKAQEKIIKKLKNNIKEPIIDLACGTGFLMSVLVRDFKFLSGNDFSIKMAKEAENNLNLKITSNNAEILGSYKKKFKTIICCNLFFYLQDRNKAIGRWVELLDKNGKILILEEYPFIMPRSKEMNRHQKKLVALIDPISPVKIIKIMAQNGFVLEKRASIRIDDKHKFFGLVFSKKAS